MNYQSQRTKPLNSLFYIAETTEENLDESFGEDTMGGPEDSKTSKTNGDDSDENGDDTIEVQNDEATGKQASDSDMDSETANVEEEETPKEEL